MTVKKNNKSNDSTSVRGHVFDAKWNSKQQTLTTSPSQTKT
jgi:hypothetical protein